MQAFFLYLRLAKFSCQDMVKNIYKIGFIGAGKLAGWLMKAFSRAGFKISQVISIEGDRGMDLARLHGSEYSSSMSDLYPDTDLIVIAVPDSVIQEVAEKMPATNSLIVHTSGAVSIDVFKSFANRYGVFYPLQTFSESREVDFSTIPVFIEASDQESLLLLKDIAGRVSGNLHEIDYESRALLHLAAVFANNFTNHLLAVSADIVNRTRINKAVMNALVLETINKSFEMDPFDSQTGPAVRGDESTIKKHLNLLSFSSELSQLYTCLTKSIQEFHSKREGGK